MPQRTRSHTLEDLSLIRLHKAFEERGWTVQRLAKDYGEDLFVRLFNSGRSTPYAFFVQAKSTDKLERYLNKTGQAINFPVEVGHVRHWVRFSEPVLLTIWDSQQDTTFWVCVQNALERKFQDSNVNKRTVRVSVPRQNVLDIDGLKRIEGITKLRFKRREREKESSELLIDLLKQARGVKEIAYEADGGLIRISMPDGSAEVHMVGELADLIRKFSRKARCSPQTFMRRAINNLYETVMDGSMDSDAIKRMFEEHEHEKERKAADED